MAKFAASRKVLVISRGYARNFPVPAAARQAGSAKICSRRARASEGSRPSMAARTATYGAAEEIPICRRSTVQQRVAHAREGLGDLRRRRRHRLRHRLVKLGLADSTRALYIESDGVVVRRRVLLAGPIAGPFFFGRCLGRERAGSASATRWLTARSPCTMVAVGNGA